MWPSKQASLSVTGQWPLHTAVYKHTTHGLQNMTSQVIVPLSGAAVFPVIIALEMNKQRNHVAALVPQGKCVLFFLKIFLSILLDF